MVATISIEQFVRKLKDIFCLENKDARKYSSVWLSDVDFGGLYQSDKFVMNVKAEHPIDSCNEEIKHIVALLFKKLKEEEFSLIWRVDVYNSNEKWHCQSEDILIYSIGNACD